MFDKDNGQPNRRKVLASIGASAVPLSLFSIPDTVSGKAQSEWPNTDFDPHDLGQIRQFKMALERMDETARENVLANNISDTQSEAFVDSLRTRHYVTRIQPANGDAPVVETHTMNDAVGEKWGWEE